MKKAREYSVSKKTIKAFIIMAVLLIPITIVMVLAGMQLTKNREKAQIEMKMNALTKLVANENEMLVAAKERFDRNLSAYMKMVTTSLKAFVTEDGYTGPRVLSDGFVAELRGDGVALPEGVPVSPAALSRSLIEQSLESGRMRTCSFVADGGGKDAETDNGKARYSGTCYLSFARIAENLAYVDITSEDQFNEDIDDYVVKNYTAVENENGGFGGITLVIGEGDGSVELLRAYGDTGGFDSLAELGISPEQIQQRSPILAVNGTAYSCNYSTLQGKWDDWEAPVMIQMLPIATIGMQSVIQSMIVCYVMVLILFNMIVYVMSVQRYVCENAITEEQAARYNPRRLRLRMTNAGAVGILAILLVSMIVQGVGQLFNELRYGRDTLRVFAKQLEQVDQDQNKAIEAAEEQWYVYFGEQMAALLAENPGLKTPGMLQNYCDILGIDFIMLFDSQGNETLCNRDYAGFTLDRGLGSNSSDFRRLLYGMPGIVHEASTDSITGLERQMIGVKLPLSSGDKQHGALIMALLPEQTKQIDGLYRDDGNMGQYLMSGTRCFAANAATGDILYASEPGMIGQTVEECGLSEKSLLDGYMDFEVVNGTKCFIVTAKYGDSIYYYAIEFDRMFHNVLLLGSASTLLFALAVAVILIVMFRGYNDEVFAECAVVCLPGETAEAVKRKVEQIRHRIESAGKKAGSGGRKNGKLRAFATKLSQAIHWDTRLPEDKAGLVFKVSMVILLLSWTGLLLSKNMVYSKFDSLAGFLLQGDWMRGANLFSFCSILLVIAYAYLINLISRGVLLMASGFLLGKGQTLCRLLHSFIKYFSLFVVLYLALHYLGFPIGTVVGSLSITTLALSLGAKDLAADILAGLSIVFERTFKVGDIVEINGNRGTVQEIGVRSTKLIVPVNNVLVISNHEIRDVLNMTQDISLHTLELKVRLSGPLSQLEDILNRELPLIGKKNDRIISLDYLGVSSLGNGNGLTSSPVVTLCVGAYCQEADTDDVTLFLNREMQMLSEREGFTII